MIIKSSLRWKLCWYRCEPSVLCNVCTLITSLAEVYFTNPLSNKIILVGPAIKSSFIICCTIPFLLSGCFSYFAFSICTFRLKRITWTEDLYFSHGEKQSIIQFGSSHSIRTHIIFIFSLILFPMYVLIYVVPFMDWTSSQSSSEWDSSKQILLMISERKLSLLIPPMLCRFYVFIVSISERGNMSYCMTDNNIYIH